LTAYEGMFLFDPAVAVEWSNVEAEVNRLIGRADGQLVACKRWDERRLAYEIRGRKRACYVLTYFRAPGDRIAALERDVQLSENILRCLVLRVDHLTDEEMKAAAEKAPEPPSDTDRGDRYGRGRFGREEDSGRPHGAREAAKPEPKPAEPATTGPGDYDGDAASSAEWTEEGQNGSNQT
jgi:small subunit ribosomal protein S6